MGRRNMLSGWASGFCVLLLMAGCASTQEELPDELLKARYTLGGAEFLSPAQVERAKLLQEQDAATARREATRPPSAQHASGANSSSGFPSAPADRRSHCDDPNSEFVQWIKAVQRTAANGGVCQNARGAYLINSEGAKKSRYCAQYYSGIEREKSFQQAEAYDEVAAQAQSTAAGSCG